MKRNSYNTKQSIMDCNLSVTKSKRSMVKPCVETPCTTLHLSHIDNLPVLRCNARTLHIFKDAPPDTAPAAVIKQALSTALVPYFPLAGRLSGHHHPLQLNCSNQGVLFVEASSPATLASFNYFHDLAAIPFHLLLPEPEPEAESESEPLVQIQVTEFACGGFVMGLVFCHSICDGLGAAQFLNDVGKLARSAVDAATTVAPTWNRDFFPPIESAFKAPAGPPPMPDYILQHANIDIPIDSINRLKNQFRESTGIPCSVFEITAACFWRSRTRAVYSGGDEEIRLVFFANCRKFVDPPLPEGFYGNCFFPVRISGGSRGIGEATVNDLVKLIQEAKGRVGREFREYVSGGGEEENDPFAPPLKYSTSFISEWGKLGFNDVDYGFGPPVHVVPIQGSAVIPVGIVGSLPLPEKGVRLMTWCVEERHRSSFLHEISQLLL